MRRELIAVFIAVATMITLAFVVPLGLTARSTASDRALDLARAEASRLAPLVALGDRQALSDRVDAVNRTERLAVTVAVADGVIGPPAGAGSRLGAARLEGRTLEGAVDGGAEVVVAVAGGAEGAAVIRVFVPDRELRRGVLPAVVVLTLVAVVLVAVAVAVADRLSRRVLAPIEELAEAARRVGQGDVGVQVAVGGPPELADTAAAFNTMSARMVAMLQHERETIGELTHRLRTPLTRLRVDLDRVEDPILAADLQQDMAAVIAEVNTVIRTARRNTDGPEAVDVVAVARERFEFWAALAADENRPCEFVAHDESAVMALDRADLAAALDVLLENVFAHTEAAVAFRLTVSGGYWGASVIVDDAGPGFDPALAGAGRSGAGSTGLGLAIVERLAATVGGSLRVGPSPYGGAQVRLVLEPDQRGQT